MMLFIVKCLILLLMQDWEMFTEAKYSHPQSLGEVAGCFYMNHLRT